MRKSVTQEFDYGCGIACYAFALGLTYKQTASSRFWAKDLAAALNDSGKSYTSKYVKHRIKPMIYKDGTIVLIRSTKNYPVGHYLIRHKNVWMDPWINLPKNRDIAKAESGFRKRLPVGPMYAIIPE